MAVKPETLQEICNLAARQVQDLYPDMQAMFLFHSSGHFHEVVATNDHGALKHPAGKIALDILGKHNHREQSGFIGLAVQHRVKWFGLASTDSILALFNINIDEFDTPKNARRAIYHHLWHAIDLTEVRGRKEFASKFRSGPLIPKRSPMNLARLNLQADVFTSVMCGLMGEDNALDLLAHQRAQDSILPVHGRRAEDYPLVIAIESARYAYSQLAVLKPAKTKYLHYARRLAIEVGNTFDDKSIRQWWGFSEPGQDMAWRNLTPEIILGCAVNTSDNAFVRATGHLVSELTGIAPCSGTELAGTYNAYGRKEQNKLLHREIAEKTFAEAVAKGVLEESGHPLISAANQQNENLAEGIILGWCAHALQAAARAFENALSVGASPLQAAHMEFVGTNDIPTWESLTKMGDTIIEQKRQGLGVTLGTVAEIGSSHADFAPLLGSVRATMKDPEYIKKLEAANDLAIRHAGPAPVAPSAPKAAPTIQYAPSAPAPNVPGLGGNAGGAARQRAHMERLRQQQKSTDTTEDRT